MIKNINYKNKQIYKIIIKIFLKLLKYNIHNKVKFYIKDKNYFMI